MNSVSSSVNHQYNKDSGYIEKEKNGGFYGTVKRSDCGLAFRRTE